MAPAETLEFRILGPVEVVCDGEALPLGQGKERVLLLSLLLYRNERVSIDRLVDLLWEESPPESAPKMVQIYVSRLRPRLAAGTEQGDRLATQAAGYRLRIEPDELDLDHFERLNERGRSALADGDATLAVATLSEALSLWRGPPFADIAGGQLLEQERARLEELRLGTLEEKNEAELALGGGAGLVDGLHELAREHPYRERFAAQLMHALYRAGRQAEALGVYKRTRDRLVDELGIEPGRPLRELEQSILRHDPALDGTTNARASSAVSPARERRTRRLTKRSVATTAAAAIVIAAATATAVALSGNQQRQIQLAGNSVGVIREGRLAAQARIGVAPAAIAADGKSIWVANTDANTVLRLDARILGVRQTIPVGNAPSGIAVGGGSVWVANGLDGTVTRIDLKASRVVQRIAVGNGPAAIAYGLGSVWVANRADQTVDRIDPKTGNVVDTLAAGTDAAAIVAGDGAVWVVDQARGRVARLEPGFTEPVLTVNVGNGPSAVALGNNSLWVANTPDSTVSRIDLRSNRVVSTIPVGAGPTSLAVVPEGVWVADEFDDTLVRIHPQTNRVDRTIRLNQRPGGEAAAGGTLLVAVGASPTSHRGGTLRVVTSDLPAGSIDPVNAGSYPAIVLTNDGLTGFRRVGGTEGTELVPDLALDLPSPTDGGRTYTFRLRRGIRYSNGALVRPEDIRRALERTLIMFRDTYYYGAIVGASACVSRPRRCDLSRSVVADDRNWTLTFHLRRADPDFLYTLALPTAYAVPAATPARDAGSHPLPATGPYEFASYKPGRVVKLIRNPRFRVWSADARPDGYPDEILWKLGLTPAAQVHAVETGRADVAFDGVPPSRLTEVETQHASQVRDNTQAGTTFLFLNTRVPPFDDVRVRRAVSYAVDRGAIVRALGGPDRAQATCQILPPNFRGYRPYCPFTLERTAAGIWQAPALSQARRLIAASGTRGARVTVWIPPNHRPEGAIAVVLLKQLGYRVRAKRVGDYYAKIGDSRLRIQAGVNTWFPDYPAPAAFLNAMFSCGAFRPGTGSNLNASEFCDPRIDRAIARARTLEVSDPALASSLWSTIDRELVDQVPVVPLVNPKHVDFLSPRVGNYQYGPQWPNLLLDQLWVR